MCLCAGKPHVFLADEDKTRQKTSNFRCDSLVVYSFKGRCWSLSKRHHASLGSLNKKLHCFFSCPPVCLPRNKDLEFQEYVFRCPQTRSPAVSEEEVRVCVAVDVPYLCVSQCPLQYFREPLKFGFNYSCCFRLQDFRVLLKVNLCGYFGFNLVRTYLH